MKRFLYGLLIMACATVFAVEAAGNTQIKNSSPNFIIILLDDMGVHDASFAGNDFIETPAMDKLASDGVVFTHAYSNSPNCAPSRAAIMSGQYAPRTGMYTMMTGDVGEASQRRVTTPKNLVYLQEKVYTLAELLHDHGYVTAQIGKWNLGSGPVRGPLGQGFDVNKGGSRVGSLIHGYWAPYREDLPGLENAPAGEYMTDRLNREAVSFIQSTGDKPFFLYLSHFAPHFPIQAPPESLKKYKKKYAEQCAVKALLHDCNMQDIYPEYAAMLDVVDKGLQQIRETLNRRGIADNTVIVLMSDNGGYSLVEDKEGFRGQKSVLYEGGIRVPMVWHVPHAETGIQISTPVSGIDIYPTFAALAGIDVSKQVLDGNNILPLFSGVNSAGNKKLEEILNRRSLYWYLPGYTQNIDGEEIFADTGKGTGDNFSQLPAAVIQRDGWKLIRYYDGTPSELYHLDVDTRETRNLYSQETQRAAVMMKALESWLQSTGGALSLPANPAYHGR
ncbi:MAG TPA: sulfatase [Pseudomonadales bacterium]|nr:sulfatase [Pseudomonadales bacterium]